MKAPLEPHLVDAALRQRMLERIEERDEVERKMDEELAQIDARFQKAKAAAPACVQEQLDAFHWRVRADHKAMKAQALAQLDAVLAKWMTELGMTD